MQDRRTFLKKATAAGAAASTSLQNLVGVSRRTSRAPAVLRPPIKGRRRIIHNVDGAELFFVAFQPPALGVTGYPARYESVDQFLKTTMKDILEETQVDSIVYCGFARVPTWEYPWKNIEALRPDPIKYVVDFAHKNSREFFYSIRMNEAHLSVYPVKEAWAQFDLKNPHLLQANVTREEFEKRFLPWIRGLSEEHPLADVVKRRGRASTDFHSWACYDYAHPEVRAHYLEVVEEACRRYDLEGIELDWNRGPLLFRTEEDRLRSHPIMTDFVNQVHQRLQHYGEKRGRPILLAIRALDSPALSLTSALDMETWVRRGWVDVLIAGSGYASFSSPLADWVRLGHENGIPVYGFMDTHAPLFFEHQEAIRAAAYRFWDEGVDGIYLMNLQTQGKAPHIPEHYRFKDEWYACLQEIGDPNRLARLNKLYQIDPRPQGRLGKMPGAEEQGTTHFHYYPFSHYLPTQIPLAFTTESGPAKAKLTVKIADHPETASEVTVETAWQPAVDPERVAWRLNGESLSNPRPVSAEEHKRRLQEGHFSNRPEPGWTVFDANSLRKGVNTFEVTLQPPKGRDLANPVVLSQVRIAITYS